MKSTIATLSCGIWLVLAMVAAAQDNAAVLDSSGKALQSGVEYYIKPAITDSGGRFTLINRNNSCPFYAGQENTSGQEGYPVIFAPFEEGTTVVMENRDQKISFSAFTICVSSNTWMVGETDSASGRRLIVTGVASGPRPTSNYFKINKQANGVYHVQWCPTEVCPTCRFICSDVGVVVENGKRLLALDGNSALPVVFERA